MSVRATTSKEWPDHIVNIYTGFQQYQVLFVTTQLKLYDLLEDEGGMTALKIASKKNINLDATERLLDYAAGLKLIRKDNGSDPAIYCNMPEVADVLQTRKPNNMVAAVLHASRIQYPLFQHFMTVIKDGNNKQAYKNAFGFEVTDGEFDSLYGGDQDYSAIFLQFMHDLSSRTAPGVAKSFDFSPFKRICDLGGGSGALAYALASEYPDVSITVLDLHPAIESAKKIRPEKTKMLKVDFVSGDIFKDDFPRANMYTFARIIHDWNDDKVHQLLEKTFNSLESGGAVLIVEQILNETKTGPLHVLQLNVQMLTEMSGRERTEKEYNQLLDQHGFVDFRCQFVKGNNNMHAMIAYKP